jgi:hypothetical protein
MERGSSPEERIRSNMAKRRWIFEVDEFICNVEETEEVDSGEDACFEFCGVTWGQSTCLDVCNKYQTFGK